MVPQYVADEDMRKTRYHDILRDDIREFVSISSHGTSEDMIARSGEQEIELDLWMKRITE